MLVNLTARLFMESSYMEEVKGETSRSQGGATRADVGAP